MTNCGKKLGKILFVTLAIFIFSSSCTYDANSKNNQKKEKHYLKEYIFSNDSFTYHLTVWKQALSEFKNKPNIHYLEVGPLEGRALLWMVENILTDPTSTATAIEAFVTKTLLNNIKKSKLENKIKIIDGYSQVELKKLPHNYFDIIYIDGDHYSSAVLMDAMLSWPLLKVGGILIFDDYLWKIDKFPPNERPQMAIDAFISSHQDHIDVILLEDQCIIRKNVNFYWEK
jgi:hypothetical protein